MHVVIAGSAKLQAEIRFWRDYWNHQPQCSVLDYPQSVPEDQFDALYPQVHQRFFEHITQADILFIANETKNGIDGYIGPETFAELSFGLAQKLVYGKKIQLILAHLPTENVACYADIVRWRRFNWIDRIMDEEKS